MSNEVVIGEQQNIGSVAKVAFNSLDIRESTKKEYSYFVKPFLQFVKNNSLNENTFLYFKKQLSERNDISISTKNKQLTSARILLKEMNRKGFVPVDITQNVKSFSQNKRHKKEGLTEDEIQKLISEINSMRMTSKSTRLRAIVCLLTLQGLRQCEAVRLDVKDIDLVNKIIHVRSKGSDDKEIVNLHPETVRALQEYIKFNKIADGALFVSWSNNNKNKRITTYSLRQIVKDSLLPLEIDKTVHGFRHYFTSKLIKMYKGDVLEVARYTRHKSLEMLQVYNDNIKMKADLPRFYRAFESINFEQK